MEVIWPTFYSILAAFCLSYLYEDKNELSCTSIQKESVSGKWCSSTCKGGIRRCISRRLTLEKCGHYAKRHNLLQMFQNVPAVNLSDEYFIRMLPLLGDVTLSDGVGPRPVTNFSSVIVPSGPLTSITLQDLEPLAVTLTEMLASLQSLPATKLADLLMNLTKKIETKGLLDPIQDNFVNARGTEGLENSRRGAKERDGYQNHTQDFQNDSIRQETSTANNSDVKDNTEEVMDNSNDEQINDEIEKNKIAVNKGGETKKSRIEQGSEKIDKEHDVNSGESQGTLDDTTGVMNNLESDPDASGLEGDLEGEYGTKKQQEGEHDIEEEEVDVYPEEDDQGAVYDEEDNQEVAYDDYDDDDYLEEVQEGAHGKEDIQEDAQDQEEDQEAGYNDLKSAYVKEKDQDDPQSNLETTYDDEDDLEEGSENLSDKVNDLESGSNKRGDLEGIFDVDGGPEGDSDVRKDKNNTQVTIEDLEDIEAYSEGSSDQENDQQGVHDDHQEAAYEDLSRNEEGESEADHNNLEGANDVEDSLEGETDIEDDLEADHNNLRGVIDEEESLEGETTVETDPEVAHDEEDSLGTSHDNLEGETDVEDGREADQKVVPEEVEEEDQQESAYNEEGNNQQAGSQSFTMSKNNTSEDKQESKINSDTTRDKLESKPKLSTNSTDMARDMSANKTEEAAATKSSGTDGDLHMDWNVDVGREGQIKKGHPGQPLDEWVKTYESSEFVTITISYKLMILITAVSSCTFTALLVCLLFCGCCKLRPVCASDNAV